MIDLKNKKLEGADFNKIIKHSGSYAILVAAVLAMTLFGVCNPGGPQQANNRGSAAKVDGEEISQKEFARAYSNNREQYSRQYGEAFDPQAFKMADMTMNQLIEERIMSAFARSVGVAVGDDEIVDLLVKQGAFKDEKGQFSKENFTNYLRMQGYTEASFLNELKRDMMLQRARQFVSESAYRSSKAAELDYIISQSKIEVEYVKLDADSIKPEVSAAEIAKLIKDKDGKKKIEEAYQRRSNEFNQAERVRARHILVAFKDSRNASGAALQRSKDDAKKVADGLLAQAKAPGADFAKIATENTDEAAGRAKGGDLGLFTRQDMVKEFSDAAFKLEPGQLSEVVESPFGFHVIKVEEKVAAKSQKLAEVQDELARNILAKEKAPALAKAKAAEITKALKAGPSGADAVLAANGLSWQTTGPTALEARNMNGLGTTPAVVDAAMALTKEKPVHADAVADLEGNLYILRLKELVKGDPKQMKPEDAERFQQMGTFTQGMSIFNALSSEYKKELEGKGRVWKNQSYLALDEPQRPDGEAEKTTGS